MSLKILLLKTIKYVFGLKEERPKKTYKKVGAILDGVDKRDYVVGLTNEELPSSIDLRPYLKERKSQGSTNSCVSHAICSAIELMMYKKNPITHMPLSERYNYYYGRKRCELFPQDGGMYPRLALKSLFEVGVAPEILCQFRENINNEPTVMARIFANPFKQRLKEYHTVNGIQGIKESLNKGEPVMVITEIYDYWNKIGKDGIIRMPTTKDRSNGFHAMMCAGFNDKGLILVNSWNLTWGNKGDCYLPYDYILQANWAIELE